VRGRPVRIFQLFVAVGALALSCCTTFDNASDEYAGVPVVMRDFEDHTYRIFDKPASSKLMVTSTLGASAEDGIVRGLTLGFAETDVPEPAYRGAVESYLSGTGRKCKVEIGQLLVRPQWEFKYRCECQAGWSLGRCGKL
jgi:hypothetical protein